MAFRQALLHASDVAARPTPLAALCALASLGAAQQLDPSRFQPAPSAVRDAGRIDFQTGARCASSAQAKAGQRTIYNNTCTWVGGSYYVGLEACEDIYDDGRVPSPSDPSAPLGALTSYTMGAFEIGYCNANGPLGASGTGADMEVAFFNNAGGGCLGGSPVTGPTGARFRASLTPTSISLDWACLAQPRPVS